MNDVEKVLQISFLVAVMLSMGVGLFCWAAMLPTIWGLLPLGVWALIVVVVGALLSIERRR